jgi:ribosome assembly protein YihI (activator of Der GTPase)
VSEQWPPSILCRLKYNILAVETYSEYESIASESEEPTLEEVKKAGRKVKAAKKGKGKAKTSKLSTVGSAVKSSEKTTKPSLASKREVPKEEERNPTSASALPKSVKGVPAGKNGQKTLNSFFGKK